MFNSHPKGLIPAALANMGERFGYYIMNAVLVLFLCSKFGLSNSVATGIYSAFYCGIYILALVGGLIADRTQNYKTTIQWGLIIMALGYVILSIPIMATGGNTTWLLTLTCCALFMIAFGNGLFKGNLQAIVGQMYDNFEADAAKISPKALAEAKTKRDPGFQIFYMFINVGGLVAPFVAPYLRSWWLGVNSLAYNADLPALCHQLISEGSNMAPEAIAKTTELFASMGVVLPEIMEEAQAVCQNYLNVFNTGVHYSFIASVAAMVISLVIFIAYKKIFPTPAKKQTAQVVEYTAEERLAMATEIKQRLLALFAVLVIAVFFWWSFHQNGTSMSLFARDFVNTSIFPPEIWQAVNPFFVCLLTFPIMWLFGTAWGKKISTPRKIAVGMGIAATAYLFMTCYCYNAGYPSAHDFTDAKVVDVNTAASMKAGAWVLIVYYFFMTVAELFISPLGLSFVSKVAPKNLLGLCQGLWLGATAIGNGLLWIGPLMYDKFPIWICWSVFMTVCLISMGIMLGMVKWLEKVTK